MDVNTLGIHCLQSVILVGLAASTAWAGQEIWKGGRADTEYRRDTFRLCGALLVVFGAAILSRYIAPDQVVASGICGMFAAGAWMWLSLPTLQRLRKRYRRPGAG
jgi:hypothetical protein